MEREPAPGLESGAGVEGTGVRTRAEKTSMSPKVLIGEWIPAHTREGMTVMTVLPESNHAL